MTRLTFLLPALLLLGCGPAPEEIEPVTLGPEVQNTSGLQERLPDTCKLGSFEGFVGQSIDALFLPPEANTRVVQPGEILSQIYVADRVNLYVDENGVVTRIICG